MLVDTLGGFLKRLWTSLAVQVKLRIASLEFLPSRLIADPAMDTSATRVDPHNVLEAEVLPQRTLTDLDGVGHVLPALPADRRALRGTDAIAKPPRPSRETRGLSDGHVDGVAVA